MTKKSNNKKMAHFGLVLTLVGLILAACGGYIWNKYSSKAGNEKHIETISQLDSVKFKINESNMNASKNQDTIIDKIDQTNKKIEEFNIMERKEPNIKVDNSPNAVIQINNNGDNIVNQNIPEPKFIFESKGINILSNGIYITEGILTIDCKVALKNLYLESHNKSIISFEVIPQRGGLYMTGHSGKREGFIFKNLPGASGTYLLITKSTQVDNTEVTYDYE